MAFEVAQAAARSISASRRRNRAMYNRAQPTILVIDDSDAIAFAVRNAMPECVVLHALDGIAALDILRTSPCRPDLIILDLVMPRMDGPTTCMLIRECAPNVP